MRNQVTLAIAVASTALFLNACADGLVTEPTTGLPSLQATNGETECVGPLAGTFDNIVVPEGATCFLNGSTVHGNVKVLQNARLFMSSDQVGGNVEAARAFTVWVEASTVEGNIKITKGRLEGAGAFGINISQGTVVKGGNIQIDKTDTGIIQIRNAVVEKGNVQLVENVTTVLLQVEFNSVLQNLQVFKNTNTGIGQFVSQNAVGEQVQCFENTGVFFHGGPNITPKAEGQCF